jgi:hypothetical protein
MELSKEHKAILASYGRSILGATAALYAAGITDPKDLWAALFGALLPVILRAVNPNDPAFGKLPDVKVVKKATSKAVKKTVAKKSTPKRVTKKATTKKK